MLYIYFIFTALKLLVIWNGNSNILSFGSVIIDSLVFEVYMVSNDVLSSNERSSDVFDLFDKLGDIDDEMSILEETKDYRRNEDSNKDI
jgi:hypothetical protein